MGHHVAKDSLHELMAFDSRDWGANRADAWLYGIICGWGLEALEELSLKHGWSDSAVHRLRLLHLDFLRLGRDQ